MQIPSLPETPQNIRTQINMCTLFRFRNLSFISFHYSQCNYIFGSFSQTCHIQTHTLRYYSQYPYGIMFGHRNACRLFDVVSGLHEKVRGTQNQKRSIPRRVLPFAVVVHSVAAVGLCRAKCPRSLQRLFHAVECSYCVAAISDGDKFSPKMSIRSRDCFLEADYCKLLGCNYDQIGLRSSPYRYLTAESTTRCNILEIRCVSMAR